MIDVVNSPYIQAADTEKFKPLVLENSYQGPVLANFWSRKAGPCLRQYPILDQLVHAYSGRLLLVNIDTETEFVFTRQYAVTSVPLLKLFRNGQVMETWRGFQAEQTLREKLDLYVSRESDQVLAEAIRTYSQGQAEQAYAQLVQAIVDDPINPRLPAAMCKLLHHEQRFDEALQLLESLPESLQQFQEFIRLREILTFSREADHGLEFDALRTQVETQPNDLVLRRQYVSHLVLRQQYELALQQLVIMMQIDYRFADDYPRQAMLRLFKLLGSEHPLVSQYRPNLSRYTH